MKRVIPLLIMLFMVVSIFIPFLPSGNEQTMIFEPIKISYVMRTVSINELSREPAAIQIDQIISNMQSEMSELESISNTKEWFLGYKLIVDKYSDVLDPPETLYDYFTQDELQMFFSVVQAEIGDEYSFEQKCNVASVILNRIEHCEFDDDMFEILTSDQFETIKNGRFEAVEVSEDTILACEYVFMFGDTTGGALFFDSNNALHYKFLFNDGAHNFYTIKGK